MGRPNTKQKTAKVPPSLCAEDTRTLPKPPSASQATRKSSRIVDPINYAPPEDDEETSSSEGDSDPESDHDVEEEIDIEIEDEDPVYDSAEFIPPGNDEHANLTALRSTRIATPPVIPRVTSVVVLDVAPAPSPASALASVPTPGPVPFIDEIRKPLEAYGDAVFRTAFDHSQAKGPKLQANATKAFNTVINFHQSAIQHAREAFDRQIVESGRLIQSAHDTNERMRKELDKQAVDIKAKDDQLKIMVAELKEIKDGEQSKRKAARKAAWDCHQASKKAKE